MQNVSVDIPNTQSFGQETTDKVDDDRDPSIVLLSKTAEKFMKMGQKGDKSKFELAIKTFNEILTVEQNYDIWNNIGICFLEIKQYENAVNAFTKGLEIISKAIEYKDNFNIERSKILSNRSAALILLQKIREAIVTAKLASNINPTNVEAWLNLGVAYANISKFEKAVEAYNAATMLRPDYHDGWKNKGLAQEQMKQYSEAESSYNRALDIDDTNANTWIIKGNFLSYIGKFEEALEAYTNSILIDETQSVAFSNRGASYSNLKMHNLALADYEKSIEIDPNNFHAWNNKGAVLTLLKRYQEAIAASDNSIKLNPTLAEGYSNKANALNLLGHVGTAFTAINKAINIDNDLAVAWLTKSEILETMDQHQEALNSVERAIKLKKDYSEAKDFLAYLVGKPQVNNDIRKISQETSVQIEKSSDTIFEILINAIIDKVNTIKELTKTAYKCHISIKYDYEISSWKRYIVNFELSSLTVPEKLELWKKLDTHIRNAIEEQQKKYSHDDKSLKRMSEINSNLFVDVTLE
ncbi:MAG: tetratricopeptide repeat protein [Candidatus Heimdallarchaeota archaeon]|nr:tetratricopeptide repeat protein [Candidatus Heimdallarchaeota archaeon]